MAANCIKCGKDVGCSCSLTNGKCSKCLQEELKKKAEQNAQNEQNKKDNE